MQRPDADAQELPQILRPRCSRSADTSRPWPRLSCQAFQPSMALLRVLHRSLLPQYWPTLACVRASSTVEPRRVRVNSVQSPRGYPQAAGSPWRPRPVDVHDGIWLAVLALATAVAHLSARC